MSETKSKPFQLDEQPSAEYEGTYTVTVTDGEISSIGVLNTGNNLYQPVNPESDLFTTISKTDDALDTISINTTGETGNVTETVLQDQEQLNQNYTRLKSEYNNRKEDLNETGEEITSIATENASVKTDRATTFRYPYDIDINQDHLKIARYEYARTEINSSKPTSSVGSVISDKNKPFGKYKGGVILPMPKVSDSNGAEWGKSDLNVFGIGALGIGGSIIKDFNEDKFPGANLFGEFADRIGATEGVLDNEAEEGNRLRQIISGKLNQTEQGIKNTALAGLGIGAQQLSKLAGIDVSADEVLARTTGKILNPNAELLFQGPVLRDFGFKFLMIARGQKEAEEIRKIIRFFKLGAAPRYLGGPALLGTPDIFQLKYMAGKSKELETVNKFNEMALRTITVDYAPDGFWSAYQDSHPVAVVMSLQFSELRPLYSTDHDKKTSESSVGY